MTAKFVESRYPQIQHYTNPRLLNKHILHESAINTAKVLHIFDMCKYLGGKM